MLWQTFLFCVLSISCIGSESINCMNDEPKSTLKKLKQKLLCGYDRDVRPVIHHKNKTTVGIIIAPRVIDYDDFDCTLRMKTWLSMHWNDPAFTWDKLEYDGIEQFTLDTSMVWVPDLSVYNTQDSSDFSLDKAVAPVMIDRQGEIYAFMSPSLASHCVPNWNNWPHDVHECTLTLGSKRYLGSTVDFHYLNKNGLWLKYLLPNNEWELVKATTNRNETKLGSKNDTDSLYLVSLNFVFTIRRHASVYIAAYLIPGVVMMIMSLGVLWIPSHRTERVLILCTLVILYSAYLLFLSYKITYNGDTTPYLVCFYRDCLLLTGILIIETLVTRSLSYCTSNPSYLQTTFRLVSSNKVMQLILVNDLDPKTAAKLMDTGNEEGSTLVADEHAQQWQVFINIINRACFVLLVPIYLLLSVSLLPVNYSFSPN